jgi:hypothetical protein
MSVVNRGPTNGSKETESIQFAGAAPAQMNEMRRTWRSCATIVPLLIYSATQLRIERLNRKYQMQNLSPRHVMADEAGRLGVASGWYSTKVSGTFVSGPHNTEADCLRKIGEIDPPPIKKRGD